MTKETVIVGVPGSPFGVPSGAREEYLGPNTHMRSEGTWLLGVALNMARHGHPTTIVDYQWGDTNRFPLPENITLQKGFYGKCDYFIDCGWDNKYTVGRFSAINARLYVHGWGGDPAGSSFLEWQKGSGAKNHYLARTSRSFQNLANKFPFNIYMPTPLVETIKPHSNFDSNQMLWGNRGAYNKGYDVSSDRLLEFMERHQNYDYLVLLYGDIVEKSREIGRLDVPGRFERLRNRYLHIPYWGIPHDEFLQQLSASKVLLANGCPSAHPQTLEAVCYGCIPVLWSFAEHHFQDANGIPLNELFKVDGPEGAFESMLEDSDCWNTYFTVLSIPAMDHEYQRSYEIFMNGIREKEATL